MPNIDVISQPLKPRRMKKLAAAFSDALLKEFPCFGEEEITIRFHPVPPTHHFIGRNALAEIKEKGGDISGARKSSAPVSFQVNIGWYAGKGKDQEARAVYSMKDAITGTINIKEELVKINLYELHEGNHFVGGKRVNIPAPQ